MPDKRLRAVIQADPVKVSLERGDVLFIGDPLFSFVRPIFGIFNFPQAFWAIKEAGCLVLHAFKPAPAAGVAVDSKPLYLKTLLAV
jgi:hypothetical protein